MNKIAESPLAWADKYKAKTELEYAFYFNPEYLLKPDKWNNIFYFRCSTNLISNASKNPFSCIWKTLEHESIGMSKYNWLKEDTRKKDLWRKL